MGLTFPENKFIFPIVLLSLVFFYFGRVVLTPET